MARSWNILILAKESFRYHSQNPLDLGEVLQLAGHRVTVAAPFADEALVSASTRGFACRSLRMTEGGTGGNQRFISLGLEEARRLRPDLLVGVNVLGFVAADLARALGLGRRCFYYALELSLPEEQPGSLATRWQLARARFADLVAITGMERALELTRRAALPRPPLVIANSTLRGPARRYPWLRRALVERGVAAHERPILLYIGSFGRIRPLTGMVRASRLWHRDALLVIMGFGGQPEERRELELELARGSDRVVLLPPVAGSRDKLLEWVSGADVGVIMMDHHLAGRKNVLWATPNKLYDYMACGLPVISSDTPTMVREVQEAGWGLCCDPHDEQALAAAVDRLLEAKEAYAARARALFAGLHNYGAQTRPVLEWIEAQAASDEKTK